MDEKAKIDIRFEEHKCQHLIEAARAAGAKATYDTSRAMVTLQDDGWGPYQISGEFVSDTVNLLGDKKAWEVIRHKMASEGGSLVYDKDILMQACRDLDV